MTHHLDVPRLTRRALLLGGVGAAATYAATSGVAATPGTRLGASIRTAASGRSTRSVHLAATDGWVSIADPTKAPAIAPFWPDPLAATHNNSPADLYVFGFRDVTALTTAQVSAQRGHAQISAPQLAFDEGTEVRITLSNLGLSQRPDLVDGHTMHWHGFVNAIPLFDGVPELSLSVPIGREFTYFYIPRDAGTYMYHCHFEDVEHVQMGMTGALFVRPIQNRGLSGLPAAKYAYNDGDASTRYDREFGFMLSEIFAEGHYRDAHIQTTDWTDFKASFSTMNGRTYPDTLVGNGSRSVAGDLVAPDGAGRLQYQPITSLVTCNADERVLLRLSSLGYLNHAMTVDNLDLTVVAKDASLLRGASGANQYLHTNTVDLGPGESRDVIFTAPDFSANRPVGLDGLGKQYNSYLLYDRDYRGAGNAGGPNPGGMMTQIRVYPPGTLGAQADPQTTPNA